MRRLLAALVLVPLAVPAGAQDAGRVFTADDYARAERMLAPATNALVSGAVVAPMWLSDGRLAFRTTSSTGTTFRVADARTGRVADAFDAARLAAALSTTLGRPLDAARLPLQAFDVADNGQTLTATVQGRDLRCALPAYTCQTVADDHAPGGPDEMSVSPDGAKGVFVRNHNLWLRDLRSGAETALTTDGVEDYGYATDNAGWVHSDAPVVTWSPDSKAVATFQHDSRGVKKWHLTTTEVGQPALDSWAYPLPGDSAVFRIARVVVHLPTATDGPRVTRLAMEPDFHRSTVSDHVNCYTGLCDLQWTPDSRTVAFLSSSRDHKQVWFRLADAQTGAVRTVLTETSATQIGDASFSENLWRVLPATNEAIWWSQKEGWTHLYLVDLATGQIKNRITSGEGNVTDVMHLDERTRTLIVQAVGKERGRDPYFAHVYKVGLDGRGWTLLTPEDANHNASLSPDGRSLVDTYSTPDTPPTTVLRDATSGRLVQTLGTADVSRLRSAGWQPPTRITVKARDGQTDLYGLMFTPSTLDRTKTYPVVVYIYPGPQTGSVGPRSFVAARGDHQALAELGFVVVAIDGMGTPYRSKAFADAYYGRMGDNTLPDQIAGVQDLARQYPFLDLNRVGIWGHSGGGFATAAAMFRYPDFFKVGIAESGNHDNRIYEDDWGERYQGLLVRDGQTDNYAPEANQTLAANLRGHLFLIHGMMDDNVPPQNTLLVVDALVKANKDFDLLMLPHARHGYGADGRYVMRRRWDYFVRHLMDSTPPDEYAIGARPAGR
ncbi:MAG: S9 family peptidase [Bacteroidetes bacterium]|nr:S9 family peptidase [Bacteroidota bacterium]